MAPFGLFGFVTVALFAILVGLAAGWLVRRNPVLRLRLLLAVLGNAILAWSALLASGFMRPWEGPLALVHRILGHTMLPLVAGATGLWLSGGSAKVRTPTRVIGRLLFLLLLCYCCANNAWNGYLGPSRFDLTNNPAAEFRFELLHQMAMPGIIGLLLALWFGRLAYQS